MPVYVIVDNFDYGLSVAEIAEQFEIPVDCVQTIVTIWPVVRMHGAATSSSVAAATPGTHSFIEMPHPPKRRK